MYASARCAMTDDPEPRHGADNGTTPLDETEPRIGIHRDQIVASSDAQHWFVPALLIVAAAGVAARIVYVLEVGRHIKLGLDATAYILLAKEIAGGSGYSDPTVLLTQGIRRATANFPPGYPIFLAGLDKLGLSTTTELQIAGACLGGITIAATGFLGRRVSGRASVGLIAAALVALSPTLIASADSSMSETVSVPLTVLVLVGACWAAQSNSVSRWILVGVLAGVLGLVRSEDLLIGLLLVPSAVLAVPDWSWRRRCGAIALAVVSALTVVSPWFVRNYTAFDPPVVVSTAADKTTAGANCNSTYYGSLIGYWDFACLGNPALAKSNEGRYGQALNAEGRAYVDAHLSRVPFVVSVRALRAWGLYDPSQEAELDAAETRSASWQHFAWSVSLLTLTIALPGLVLVRRNRFGLVLLAGPAVIDTLVVAGTYGNDRFVLSAIPSLCVAAGITIEWLRPDDRNSNQEPTPEPPETDTPTPADSRSLTVATRNGGIGLGHHLRAISSRFIRVDSLLNSSMSHR